MTEAIILAIVLLAAIFSSGDKSNRRDYCGGQYCFFCESAEFNCREQDENNTDMPTDNSL